MTESTSTVDVAFWRQTSTGEWIEQTSDSTLVLPSPGWKGEVEAAAEGLLADDFSGIAIVIDNDDKGVGAIMDVLTVRPEHQPTRVII